MPAIISKQKASITKAFKNEYKKRQNGKKYKSAF